MKKLIALSAICLMMVSIVFAQKTMKTTVYFDHDKYNVQTNSLTRLDSVFKKLNKTEITSVSITGHTDSDGSNGYSGREALDFCGGRARKLCQQFRTDLHRSSLG